MKTKFFKTGLPIMAFLMAIGLAFATESSSMGESALVKGYIHKNGCQERIVNCSILGSTPCTLIEGSGNYQVFGDTNCKNTMYWP